MNKNEREWYDGHAARIVQAIQLRGDQKEAYERIAELVSEERKRVLEEVREVVKKHSAKNAHILTPAPRTCLKILSRLDSLMKSDSPEKK